MLLAAIVRPVRATRARLRVARAAARDRPGTMRRVKLTPHRAGLPDPKGLHTERAQHISCSVPWIRLVWSCAKCTSNTSPGAGCAPQCHIHCLPPKRQGGWHGTVPERVIFCSSNGIARVMCAMVWCISFIFIYNGYQSTYSRTHCTSITQSYSPPLPPSDKSSYGNGSNIA